MINRFPTRPARRLERELSGDAGDKHELMPLVHELRRLGLDAPTSRPAADAREALRLGVLAQAAEARRPGALARVRGATFVAAGVAGAGLVVASAASGSNPAVFVADAARELPRIARQQPPPATLAIEGEVLASHDGGRTLELRAGADTITVEAPKGARDVTASGTPVSAASIEQGANIRVTADRDAAPGTVAAKKIEVLPPSAVADASPRPGSNSSAAPPATSTSDTRPALASATQRPAQTPKPSPTKAPAIAANDTTIAIPPASPPTRTPTPKHTPTATPTPAKPTIPSASASETNNVTSDSANPNGGIAARD